MVKTPEKPIETVEAEAPAEEHVGTVAELRDELRERDLPVSGTKSELIERLAEADAEVDPLAEADADAAVQAMHDADVATMNGDEPADDPTRCVVNDGRCVGKATHGGRVCSAHAVHYYPDGTRRV